MRILKDSKRQNPKVSLILLDWGVRESFHLLHYLKTQTVPRDSFEVIIIEYYDHVSEAVRKFESEVDTWILLEMPDDCYYHKHLMYNAGIVFSRGDILMIGDSDAMVRPTFIGRIISSFESDPLLAYHMDEFRNVRRDLYPFNYPSFEEVLGDGCINNVGGKTKGVLDVVDPVHTKNYGACMCARREDVVAIGGADEDMTYLGHICGPYDMTFRLMNFGRRFKWETEEFLYHTWHPGTDGTDNYLGPHDGLNMSTTAFKALNSGRLRPLVENRALREMRNGGRREVGPTPELLELLIDPQYKRSFSRSALGVSAGKKTVSAPPEKGIFALYKGFDIYRVDGSFYGVPENLAIDMAKDDWRSDYRVIPGRSFNEIRHELDSNDPRLIESVSHANICAIGERYVVVPHSLGSVDLRFRKQREDPRILWIDTLPEARTKAATIAKDTTELKSTATDSVPVGSNGISASRSSTNSMLADQIAQLNERVSAMETAVHGIYKSSFWQIYAKSCRSIRALFGNGSKSS